jgi:hypothetical protein
MTALVESLGECLAEEVRYRAVMELGSEKGAVAMSVNFQSAEPQDMTKLQEGSTETYRPAELKRRHKRGLAQPSHGDVVLLDSDAKSKDVAYLKVELKSGSETGEPYHVTVLCVSEDRSIQVLYPLPGARDNKKHPGEVLSFPFEVVVNDKWREKRPMRDRYLVIATRSYADFTSFTRESRLRGSPPDESSIPPLIAQAFRAHGMRGVAPVPTAGDFGIQAIDIFAARTWEE